MVNIKTIVAKTIDKNILIYLTQRHMYNTHKLVNSISW